MRVSGRFRAFLTFGSYIAVPYVFFLPLLLLSLALTHYEGLSQGLKRAMLHVVGVQESALVPLAPVLGLIFGILSMAVSVALTALVSEFHTIRTLSRHSEILLSLSDSLVSLAKSVGKLAEITTVHPPLESGKTNAIKHEIEQSVSAMVREMVRETEQRLQSEWRFVVVLISSVILGAVAIFATLLTLKT